MLWPLPVNKQVKNPLRVPSQQLTSTQPVWAAENWWQSPNASQPIYWELESLMDISEHWLHKATASPLGAAHSSSILRNMQHSCLCCYPFGRMHIQLLSWQPHGLLYSNGFGNTAVPGSFQGTQSSAITYLWFDELILLWSIWDAPKGGEVVIGDNCRLQMKPEMLCRLRHYLWSQQQTCC